MRDSDAALLRNSPETLSLPTASLQNKNKSACSSKLGQTDEGFGRRLATQFPRTPQVCRWHPCKIKNKSACSSKLGQTDLFFILRKVGDSNPRYAYAYTAFRVRLFRPLRQLSFNSTAKVVLFS